MSRLVVLLMLCACPGKQTAGPGGGGSQAGSSTVPAVTNAKTCDDVRTRVEQMYREEAQSREPTRVDEAVADNTAMVMADCAKDPATFVPCIASAPSIAELEKRCVVPLDDEGTEAER